LTFSAILPHEELRSSGKYRYGEVNPLRAVVTGGAGFLGSHLCDYLIDRGWDVLSVDNLVTGTAANVRHLVGNPRFRMVQYDVTKFIDVPGPVDYLKLPFRR
jgi:dTDP-glucose 4,6-dehydratase